MRAIIVLESAPANGLHIIREGKLTRLFFDFSQHIPVEGDPVGGEWDCENVDVIGDNYDVIVAAIVKDRYTEDRREAILANYEEAKDSESDLTDAKRAEYIEEYKAFQEWRRKAKQIARSL